MQDIRNKEEAQVDVASTTELFYFLLGKWPFYLKLTALFSVISILISLSLSNEYESRSLLKIVNSTGQANSFSQLGGVAAIAGIDIPSGGTKEKLDLVRETLLSRDFFNALISKPNFLPNLMAFDSYDAKSGRSYINPELFDEESNSWKTINNTSLEPAFSDSYKEYLKNFSVSISRQTQFLSLSYRHESPVISYQFLSQIIKELNSQLREIDLRESQQALNYLNQQLGRTKQAEIKDSINELIASKLEVQMLANVNKDYAIKPVDKPFIPEVKSGPARALITIMGSVLGFLISISYVAIRLFITKLD